MLPPMLKVGKHQIVQPFWLFFRRLNQSKALVGKLYKQWLHHGDLDRIHAISGVVHFRQ